MDNQSILNFEVGTDYNRREDSRIGKFAFMAHASSGCFAGVFSGHFMACCLYYPHHMSIRSFAPNHNSPEPTPITHLAPHSRLTVWAARLSFCRCGVHINKMRIRL
jgi:hypothetical protein